MKKITSLVFNLAVALLLVCVSGLPVMAAPALAVLGGFAPQMKGVAGMALQKEIWESDIVANLFADNSFLSKAFNADQYVLAGKVVHIPQAGSASTVVKNRSSLPAVAVQRSDSEVTYNLDEYTTTPRLIVDAEKVELSYDKRQSIIGEDKANLLEVVSNNFIYNWSPATAAQILRTTGDAVATHLTGATGNRKALKLEDVSSAAFLLNTQNVPQEGRYGLLDAWMYKQLLDQMTANQSRDFLSTANPATGVIGRLFGFDLYMRSLGAKYTNASTPAPKLYSEAGAAADNAAAIFWQTNAVERALGMVKMFDNPGEATYYGDILSFLVRAGGRVRHASDRGVVAVVQAATT